MSGMKRLGVLVPIALLVMSITACDRTVTYVDETQQASNCFSCHDDQNTFLVSAEQQWRNSIHASGNNINRGGSASCAGCHASEGFIQRVNGETVTGEPNPTSIHCFTCHQPHTNGDFGLRYEETAVLQNGESFDLGPGNLCAYCHQARRNVDTYVGTVGTDPRLINSTHWGPHHSNQADMLIGSNGYEYSGFTYEQSPHRTAVADACVDCHKNLGTRNNVVGGHTFNQRAIVRDEGGEESEILNTAACADCHGSQSDFDVNGRQTEVAGLIVQLEAIVEAAGLWTNGHPNSGVTTSVDSAGAVWNLLMAEEDRSIGVHNAKYTVGLLQSSIDYMTGNLPQPKPAPIVEAPRPGDNVSAIR